MPLSKEMQDALTAPFAVEDHSFRVMRKYNNRALLFAYIDARNVMQRLDEVFGAGGWADTYEVVRIERVINSRNGQTEHETAVTCTLTIWMETNEGWMTNSHQDVGTGDGADGVKGAYSDALKRAAVKLGIGRYIYGLKNDVWYELDEKGFNLTLAAEAKARQDLRAQLGLAPAPAASKRPATLPEESFERKKADPVVNTLTPEKTEDFFDYGDEEDDGLFSEVTATFVGWCQGQSEKDTRTPSMPQVDLVSKVIDRITGASGSAAVVLDALHATEGYSSVVVKELLDTLLEETRDRTTGTYVANKGYKPERVEVIKEIYQAMA